MPEYKVNHNYRSGTIGLDAGRVVELDEATAGWLERDSPGVLTLVDGEAPASDGDAANTQDDDGLTKD